MCLYQFCSRKVYSKLNEVYKTSCMQYIYIHVWSIIFKIWIIMENIIFIYSKLKFYFYQPIVFLFKKYEI